MAEQRGSKSTQHPRSLGGRTMSKGAQRKAKYLNNGSSVTKPYNYWSTSRDGIFRDGLGEAKVPAPKRGWARTYN